MFAVFPSYGTRHPFIDNKDLRACLMESKQFLQKAGSNKSRGRNLSQI